MGKLIISWSPVHGQSATTSNVSALASHFALTYDTQSLITHTQHMSLMEKLFGKQKTQSRGFEDSGIFALERLARSNLIKEETAKDYTESIYKNSLDLLGDTSELENNPRILQYILTKLEKAYDIVWVDAHSGTQNEVTRILLKNADLVLVNLPQNVFILERFANGIEFPDELKGKDYIILISQYEQNISPNILTIKRRFKFKQPVFPILYSPKFKEACNQGNIHEMIYRAVGNEKTTTHEFIDSLAKVNKLIAKKLEITFVRADEK